MARNMTTVVCCSHSFVAEIDSEQPTGSGSLDTIDGTLLGCDSNLDEQVGAGRQVSALPVEEEGEPLEGPGGHSAVLDRGMLHVIDDDDTAVQNEEGRRHGQAKTLEVTTDFGAAEVAAPPKLAIEYKFMPSPGSRSYGTAKRRGSR